MSLIITCPRNLEKKAAKEIFEFVKEIGSIKPDIIDINLSGIFMINTDIDPDKFIEKFKQKINDQPWSVRYCSRLIPIQSIVKSELDLITRNITKLLDVIKSDHTFRITVENRNSSLSTTDIILEIGNIIPNKVSLENPDWEILVEILGDKTGLSVLPKNSILSVQKTKRDSSD